MRLLAVSRYRAILLATLLGLSLGCAKAPDDSQVTQQIQERISQDSGLGSKTITVQNTAGVVTLSGTVDSDAQRTAASRYASAVPGVKQVVNDLQVAAPAPKRAPQEVAQAAPPPRSAAKPKPSVPRRKKDSDVPDQNFWDKDSVSKSNDATDQAKAVAAAIPIPTPVAPAPPTPPPAPKKMTIALGTTLAIRLVDAIDSETSQQGETFRATLDSPLTAEGEVAIPAGYNVEGHIVDVKSAGKFAGQSVLVLQLDRISAGGKSYSLQTDEYRRQGSNRTTNTAEKVGAGAVIGAVLGGIIGGGKGAGVGAAAGGGLGGGVQAATKGQQIKLPSETVLNFSLQSPLTVTKVDQGPDAGRHKLDNPQ
jgi:hypothetical protein